MNRYKNKEELFKFIQESIHGVIYYYNKNRGSKEIIGMWR